uniref:VP3 n=1 Tax=Hubei lepidoptera virus 5 TaxID=1922907 RepID=A0A1L3KP77_9VIRU|nr:hypothetical protein 2 [Hubei lepidoptera virus 5]
MTSTEAKTDDATEKKEEKEKVTEKKEEKVSVSQLFDLLGSLRSVLSRNTNICVEEKSYGVNGYGPNSWSPVISDKITTRYEVITIGADRTPYVVRKPIVEMKITKIDDLYSEISRVFNVLLNQTMIFMKEPPSLRLINHQCSEPESLGIPYSRLLESGINPNEVNNALHRFLMPTRRMDNFNYSDGYIFNGLGIGEEMRDFFDIAQREMRVLSQSIETEELRTRNHIPDTVKLPLYGNNVMFEVVMNPFLITNMYDHLPRSMRFASSMILELQKPDVTLGPIDINTLQKTASISLTRSSSISAMFSIDYTPDMSDAINAYLMSLIMPGLIEFDIDLSDINPADNPLRMVTACLSKLLLSRSAIQRWNSVTGRGVRVVEHAIVEACTSAQILTPAAHMGMFPLNRVHAVPNIHINDLNGIVTDDTGAGWREGAIQRFAAHPVDMPYAECSYRQRYVHDIENVLDLESPDRTFHFNNWRVAATASNLLSVANRNGEDRASYSGVSQVFKLLANRIFDFYAVINEYNLLNWYSSLRPSENVMNAIYDDGSEEPTVVTLNGKTILYLAKCLCRDTQIVRRTPVLAQMKAECALARDCAESAIKAHIYAEVNRIYGIPENSFRAPERVTMIKPSKGPLHEHLCLLISSGLASSVGPFYNCVINTPMYELMVALINVILENPIDFGILPSIELATQVADRSVRALEAYARNNIPYTNIGVFERDAGNMLAALARERVSFEHMTPLINAYSLQQTIRDLSSTGVLELAIPMSFEVNTRSIIEECDRDLLKVKYDPKRRDNNLRFCINWSKCTINVTDVDRDKLTRPDLYILNFSTINRVSIPQIHGNKIFMSATQWLANIEREATRCVYVRTDNVHIKTIFDRS